MSPPVAVRGRSVRAAARRGAVGRHLRPRVRPRSHLRPQAAALVGRTERRPRPGASALLRRICLTRSPPVADEWGVGGGRITSWNIPAPRPVDWTDGAGHAPGTTPELSFRTTTCREARWRHRHPNLLITTYRRTGCPAEAAGSVS